MNNSQEALFSIWKNAIRKPGFTWMPLMAFVGLWIVLLNELSVWKFNFYFFDYYFLTALFFIVFLIPFNIGFEALKFSVIRRSGFSVWDNAIKICMGCCMQFLLPFGLGMVTGRIWNSKEIDKRAQIEASILGGTMQSISNLSGLVLLAVLPTTMLKPISGLIPDWGRYTILSILLFSGFILLATWYFRKWQGWSIWKKIKPLGFMCVGEIKWSLKKLSGLFAWSMMRYFIYLLQWVLLLALVGKLSLTESLVAAIVYLIVLTFVVLPPVFSVASRNIIAWTVFGAFGLEPSMSIFFSCLIFLLNNAVPAMFGFLFLLKAKDGS